MNEFNENDIGTLLRLKRHEQPPPGYFDNFLHEFHRRQRAELLREPLWRIGLRRAQDFMVQLSVPSLTSYPAAATAVVILAAVLSFKMSQAPQSPGMVARGNCRGGAGDRRFGLESFQSGEYALAWRTPVFSERLVKASRLAEARRPRATCWIALL